jgi:PAS domain S-box-containing protein
VPPDPGDSGEIVISITNINDNNRRESGSPAVHEKERMFAVHEMNNHDERQSEEKFRTLFDKMTLGVFYQNSDGSLVDINPAALQMFGLTREQFLGRDSYDPHWNVISEDGAILPAERHPSMIALRTGKPVNNVILGVHNPVRNDYTWMNINATPLFRPGEVTPFQLFVTMDDITERKQAEEALSESERKFREIFNNANDGIHLHEIGKDGRPGKYIDVNDVACRMVQYSRDEMLQRGPLDITTEYHNPPLDKILEELRTVGKSIFETGHIRNDGTIVPVEINAHVITLFGRNGVLSVCRDITERKRVEAVLQKSEKQYRSLLDQVPELILVHQKGIIKYVNPSALKTLGYEPQDAANRPVTDFIAPEYHDQVIAVVRQRTNGIAVEPYEIEILGKDGGRRTVIVSGSLIEFEGTPASLNVLTDITDRKALEVAVQQANRKLNLLSSITRHDIINQLTLLLGYNQLCRRYLDDKKILTAFLDKEAKAATTIEQQIRFTKEYQDVGVAAPAWQNVSASITQAVAELPMRSVRVDVDKDDLEIFADPLFEKVFYNLIDNALRYGGEQMTTVRVSSKESDTCLTLLCEDDGAGITEAEKKQLFTQGFGKNTGLGLFLTREILAITGITIAENGAPGKGGRFEITVPKGAYRFRGKG